jgi:hypothetical protein
MPGRAGEWPRNSRGFTEIGEEEGKGGQKSKIGIEIYIDIEGGVGTRRTSRITRQTTAKTKIKTGCGLT